MKTTESGFHDGPPAVSSPSRVTSRPQMIHDHASNAIAHGASSDERRDDQRGGDHDGRPPDEVTQGW